MKISELTDVELNRAMIEMLYGKGDKDIERLYQAGKLNFLDDWNLAMPLAVEHGLSIELPEDEFDCVGTVTKYIHGNTDIAVDFDSKVSPLRAISEVLVMIKLGEK